MKTVQMSVSQTVALANGKKERKEAGTVEITVPILEDLLPLMASKVTGEEDGLPVYDQDAANFIQSAILSYVKINARNKTEIVDGKVKVKDGLKIATNWEELCQEGTRGGGAAALAIAREAKEAFAAWFKTLAKSEAATATAITLFSNRAALEMQDAKIKEKMQAYVSTFAESLSEELLEKFQRPLENVLNAAQAVKDAEDF